MTTHTSRHTLRLASALVTAGLCLSAAPPALAAGTGDGDVLKLSTAQADKLAARVTLDAYGDAQDHAEKGQERRTASAPTEADAAAPVTFTPASTLEGVRGMGATAPVGRKGDYFMLTSLGSIQRRTADGDAVWERTNSSLYEDWQAKPLRPWQTEPYPARILMGYNAVSPFSPTSDNGYSTDDLTGDGTDDLVFTASVGAVPYRPITSPGSSLSTGTFVTVVDGATGKTLWSKLYDYASAVRVVDGTLLVADAPRMSLDSPAADTAKLTGIRFTSADGALTPASTWTYDTGETGSVNWGDLQDIGAGRAVVSWDRAGTDDTEGLGRTLVLDSADGSVLWSADSALYSRQLRLDAGRGRIVALEQADPTDGVRYEIAAYDLASGRRETLDSRVNVLPTALTVGALDSRKGAEYAVSESSLDSNLYVNAATVRALDGDAPGSALWSHTFKRDPDNIQNGASVWRLAMADGRLIASAENDEKIAAAENVGGSRLAALTVFSAKGAIKWQEKGTAASPMYQEVVRDGHDTRIRVVDQSENVRTFRLGNGKQRSVTPLRADIGHARAADLDKDGASDVVMAGSSNGVWAYSGPSLVSGRPEKLWRATVPGPVHELVTGDVTGDGRPEVVVAADTAVIVLDGRTGRTLTTVDGGGAFVRSVTLADLDRDGARDLLVPTGTLDAYDGAGHRLWSYSAPADLGGVVFADPSVADGRVYTSYSRADAITLADPAAKAVALNAGTGEVEWHAAPEAPARSTDGVIHAALTYRGTFASPEIPYADGHAVVHLWAFRGRVGGTDAVSLQQYMEIRDGRTGEVVHTAVVGGLWTHNAFFTDGGVLYQAGTSSFRAFRGEDEEDLTVLTVPQSYAAGFATGPGGRKLLIGGVESGVYAWDPSVFGTPGSYVPSVGSAGLMGGRNHLAADLDGDGTDEVLSLNGDDYGRDRIAEDLGGRYLVQDNGIHQVTTYKLS